MNILNVGIFNKNKGFRSFNAKRTIKKTYNDT